MKVKVLLGIFIIAIGAGFGYLYLGGANKIDVEHEQVRHYILLGMEYSGRYKSKELEEIFYDVKSKLDSNLIDGVLAIVNYKLPSDSVEAGYVHQFLGVKLQGGKCYYFPEGYSPLEIQCKSVIKAKINAHNLVMPSPESVEKEINKFAELYNLTTANYTVENYVSDRELIVEVPVVE